MATPTRFPQDKIERLAKFGTVVESCSKKVAASTVWAFADTLDGEGGASANFAAVFFPSLLLRTGRKIWQSSPENLFVFSEQDLTKTGAKKQETFA